MRNQRLLGQARDHFDWALFLCAALLAVIGVINLYSATSVSRDALREVYVQQVYWLVFGGIIATLVAAIDYRHYERLGYALYGFGIVLLGLVFVLGRDIRGSSRWINIGTSSRKRFASLLTLSPMLSSMPLMFRTNDASASRNESAVSPRRGLASFNTCMMVQPRLNIGCVARTNGRSTTRRIRKPSRVTSSRVM